jgi:dGTPase
LEVSQIARALARSLGVDEDLAEALALSHDLGHTPFGHSGENALNACMISYGGFDHNAQTLRIVTKLEHRYATFDGLNLTWETLEGLVKHNGPLLHPDGTPFGRYAQKGIPVAILDYDAIHPLILNQYASLEAQCAAIADDIAYNAHDIDDGLRAGLFELEDLRDVPFLSDILDEIDQLYPQLENQRRIHELTRRVITRFVEDVIKTSKQALLTLAPNRVDDIRRHNQAIVAFSEGVSKADQGIKAFLFPHMYHHPMILKERDHAEQVVHDLFALYIASPTLMGEEWREGAGVLDELRLARRVADYIAGMTDGYALQCHKRLLDYC